jgi:hypothetical protein
MNWKIFWAGAIAAAVINGALMVSACGDGQDAYGLYVAGRFALLLGLPALAILAVVLLLKRDWRVPRTKFFETTLAVLAAVAVLFTLLMPASFGATGIAGVRCDRAKARIDWTVAALDQYKGAHDGYPATLAEAEAAGIHVPVPDMAAKNFYRPNPSGRTFELALDSPKPFTECVYNSNTQEWYDHKTK